MTNQNNVKAADPAAEWTLDRRYRHLLRCAIAFLLPGRINKVAGQTRAEVAHQLQVMLAEVESFVTAQPDAHSVVGLSQGDGTVLAADIDQRVPVRAAEAEKVDAVAVDLGRHGGEHDLKAAASALPHHGAPVECQDRSAVGPFFDNGQAYKEGWAIFDCVGSENGRWQIQRDDEESPLADDPAAWRFVMRNAKEGSEYHQDALDFLKEHDPIEYAVMHGYGEGVKAAEQLLSKTLSDVERVRPRVKEHEIAKLVNRVRDIARELHGPKHLRERIAQVIRPAMEGPPGGKHL